MNRGGHSHLLQDSCLENPVDRGAWRAAIYGVTLSRTRLKQLSMHACMYYKIKCSHYFCITRILSGLPWWLSSKESTHQGGRRELVPALQRSPGEGNGNPLQYSFLENPIDWGAWQATVHGTEKKLGDDLVTK